MTGSASHVIFILASSVEHTQRDFLVINFDTKKLNFHRQISGLDFLHQILSYEDSGRELCQCLVLVLGQSSPHQAGLAHTVPHQHHLPPHLTGAIQEEFLSNIQRVSL